MNREEWYERTIKSSELVIAIDEFIPNESYQERMIMENDIFGILPMKVVFKNERKEYHYTVSSLISLRELVKKEKITYSFLRLFFFQIMKGFEAMERFMLEEDLLLMDPDHLFLNNEKKEIRFLYFPEKEHELSNFLELAMFFMTNVDGDDEMAVWTVYMLENHARTENFSIVGFMDMMLKHEKETRGDERKENTPAIVHEIEKVPEREKMEAEYMAFQVHQKLFYLIRKWILIIFALSSMYFCAAMMISRKFEFEYQKSIYAIIIIVGCTLFSVLWSVADFIRWRKESVLKYVEHQEKE